MVFEAARNKMYVCMHNMMLPRCAFTQVMLLAVSLDHPQLTEAKSTGGWYSFSGLLSWYLKLKKINFVFFISKETINDLVTCIIKGLKTKSQPPQLFSASEYREVQDKQVFRGNSRPNWFEGFEVLTITWQQASCVNSGQSGGRRGHRNMSVSGTLFISISLSAATGGKPLYYNSTGEGHRLCN